MFQARLNIPSLMKWQARLARVPRWAWIAFFVGAVVPVVVLLVLTLAAALLTGVIVMMAVLLVGTVLGLLWRIFNLRGRDDSRRNMQIIVTGHRVIDP